MKMNDIIKKLNDYLDKLKKEYKRCVILSDEFTEKRSDNYYYHTRVELLREIIDDLYIIIKTIKELEND